MHIYLSYYLSNWDLILLHWDTVFYTIVFFKFKVQINHLLAEGIWLCKPDQINADPKGHWYWLAWKISKLYMNQSLKAWLDKRHEVCRQKGS